MDLPTVYVQYILNWVLLCLGAVSVYICYMCVISPFHFRFTLFLKMEQWLRLYIAMIRTVLHNRWSTLLMAILTRPWIPQSTPWFTFILWKELRHVTSPSPLSAYSWLQREIISFRTKASCLESCMNA